MAKFHKGEQIVYIPNHAGGDPDHPDCERGFVYRGGSLTAKCRFWHRDQPGVMRTRANSEKAYCRDLKHIPDYIPQEVVDAWLTIIDWEDS